MLGGTIQALKGYIPSPTRAKVFETGTQSVDKTLSVTVRHLENFLIGLSQSRSLGTFERIVRNPAPISPQHEI